MTSDEPQWEPWMEQTLATLKAKFISDRVKGFQHPESKE